MMLTALGLAAVLAPVLPPQSTAWKRFEMPKLRMSALLLDKPAPRLIRLEKGVDVRTFEWMESKGAGVTFMFNFTEYKGASQVDLKGAMNGALEALKSSRPGAKISTTSRPVTINGLPGIRFQASFPADGDQIVYSSIIAGKGKRVWQAIATYSADPTASAVAAKALSGIQIRP